MNNYFVAFIVIIMCLMSFWLGYQLDQPLPDKSAHTTTPNSTTIAWRAYSDISTKAIAEEMLETIHKSIAKELVKEREISDDSEEVYMYELIQYPLADRPKPSGKG